MLIPTKQELIKLEKKYTPGTRIKLISMHAEANPVPSGTTGSVMGVDDIGTIHMIWDNHSTLGIIPGIDDFEIISSN